MLVRLLVYSYFESNYQPTSLLTALAATSTNTHLHGMVGACTAFQPVSDLARVLLSNDLLTHRTAEPDCLRGRPPERARGKRALPCDSGLTSERSCYVSFQYGEPFRLCGLPTARFAIVHLWNIVFFSAFHSPVKQVTYL